MRGRIPVTRRDVGLAASVVTCGVGAAFLLQAFGLGVRSGLFWPVVIGAAGLVLVWVQVDEVDRSAVLGVRRWQGWLRVALGLTLIIGAVVIVLLQSGQVTAIGSVLGVLLLAIAGTLLVVGPWFVRLWRNLQDERAERVRTQERADVAAHLHDSVLQTLALIQRTSATRRRSRRWRGRRSASCAPGCTTGRPGDAPTLRAALRGAGGRGRGRARACRSRWSSSATRRSTSVAAAARARDPRGDGQRGEALGRRQVDVYAEVGAGRRSRCSSATAGAGSTRRGPDRPAWACAARSSTGWSGTAVSADVTSAPGEGTEVRLLSQPIRGEPSRTSKEEPMSEPLRVVVVDDHAMFRPGVGPSSARDRSTSSARPADVDAAVAVDRRARRPTSCCSTSTCPAAAAPRCCGGSRRGIPDIAVPRAERLRRGRGRHRGDPRRRPRLRHEDDHRRRAGRRDQPGAATATRCSRRGWPASCSTRSPGTIEVAAVDEDLDRLTEREREVMRLIARGYAYKEVAAELFISVKTVETHVSSVLRKLQLSSRHELTRWASDRRLL